MARCEVRIQGRSVHFELLPKDLEDETWSRCPNKATVRVDWKNGRLTNMCDKHDRESKL